VAGVYDGVTTFGELKKYGDFGIGTVEALDGEVIIFDGHVLQVTADGKVHQLGDSVKTPFASVTFFDADKSQIVAAGLDFPGFQTLMDKSVPSINMFYAIRIDGIFSYVKTRSVPAQKKPYPPLVEVTKNQPEFEFHDVEGTIVGFRAPPYVSGINVTGYHLHFVTKDLSGGGHLLEFRVKEGTTTVDITPEFYMTLPGKDSDFYKTDFSQDRTEELNKAEK